MDPNTLLLNGRYQLLRILDSNSSCETWLAEDERTNPYIAKLWSFSPEDGNELPRALWNAELRRIYRISSTPGAEQYIVVIHDAGIDRQNKCFVLIMKRDGDGFEPLSNLLIHRRNQNYEWLSQEQDARLKIWDGLRRVAQGIEVLHSQNVLHRNISPENVYVHPEIGSESFRISGFEWSIRIGELNISPDVESRFSLPPEADNNRYFGYHLDTDWYAFGILAARCLMNIEATIRKRQSLRQLNSELNQKIASESNRYLSNKEKELLSRLLNPNPVNRFLSSQGSEIIRAISEVIDALRSTPSDRNRHLLMIYNPETHSRIVEAAIETGFIPNPNKQERFEPRNAIHTNNLSVFIQEDMREAILYNHGDRIIIVGQRLSFQIIRWEDRQSGQSSWDAAFIHDSSGLYRTDTEPVELPIDSIVVRTQWEVRRPNSIDFAQSQSWKSHLPQRDRSFELRTQLAQFHNFIRCTNQIELLLIDATLFQYEIVTTTVTPDNVHEVVIRETKRSRPTLDFLETDNGLVEFLQRERESGKQYRDSVILTEHSSLRLKNPRRGISNIQETDAYKVVQIDDRNKTVTLRRANEGANQLPFPSNGGWLRIYTMDWQIELIRRRKEAIDNLNMHSYLLKSLCVPRDVYIDIGEYELPRVIPDGAVDEAKQAIMQDVLRTRPVYALQGPPGTGKTTMVAYLLSQIFEEDPTAQVLITAQAHSAVDVLRRKVQQEVFSNSESRRQPLSIRLGNPRRSQVDEQQTNVFEGSVESTAISELQRSVRELNEEEHLTELQKEWLNVANEMLSEINTIGRRSDEAEFVELVKRSANITFSTTSAGDLEELASGTQYYDWSIIEEAGKCHGFDLALPMQAGHRWLLIGDQFQLPPYRFNEFKIALNRLDDVIHELRGLPDLPSDLLDYDWIRQWESLEINERSDFSEFAKTWLRTFATIFEQCEKGTYHAEKHRTLGDPIGAIAGMLSKQYRMHPTIGDLVSKTYYKGLIQNNTVDATGQPKSSVLVPLEEPAEIPYGIGVVWIDTPDSLSGNTEAVEQGPDQGKARFSNLYEAKVVKGFLERLRLEKTYVDNLQKKIEVAVLSPYNQQVSLLRQQLNLQHNFRLNDGIVPRSQLSARTGDNAASMRLVHTVDSFQGNEADIVVVSLVRNNLGTAIGFLRDQERMNVLLSRAQRLLVLVGSWDFFQRVIAPIPANDDTREEAHLKRAMTLLEEWFENGVAIKISSEYFIQ